MRTHAFQARRSAGLRPLGERRSATGRLRPRRARSGHADTGGDGISRAGLRGNGQRQWESAGCHECRPDEHANPRSRESGRGARRHASACGYRLGAAADRQPPQTPPLSRYRRAIGRHGWGVEPGTSIPGARTAPRRFQHSKRLPLLHRNPACPTPGRTAAAPGSRGCRTTSSCSRPRRTRPTTSLSGRAIRKALSSGSRGMTSRTRSRCSAPIPGSIVTLPGGVLLVLDGEWSQTRVDTFFAGQGIAAEPRRAAGFRPERLRHGRSAMTKPHRRPSPSAGRLPGRPRAADR